MSGIVAFKQRDDVRAYARAYVKTPRGRRCRSCGVSDDLKAWSNVVDLCGACRVRGQVNGFCETCEAALYAAPTGRGKRERPRCRCEVGPMAGSDAFRLAVRRLTRRVDSPNPGPLRQNSRRPADARQAIREAKTMLALSEAIRFEEARSTGSVIAFAGMLGLGPRQATAVRLARYEAIIARFDPGFAVKRKCSSGSAVCWTGRLIDELERWAEDLATAAGGLRG